MACGCGRGERRESREQIEAENRRYFSQAVRGNQTPRRVQVVYPDGRREEVSKMDALAAQIMTPGLHIVEM